MIEVPEWTLFLPFVFIRSIASQHKLVVVSSFRSIFYNQIIGRDAFAKLCFLLDNYSALGFVELCEKYYA